jgi:hypothetical protein
MRIALIGRLEEGARRRAMELVRSGPPFDPDLVGLERHYVFLTDREAVFLFEADGPDAIEKLSAEAALWVAASAWKDLLAAPPVVAENVYGWVRPNLEGLTFSPVPGPGDSDGGDLYKP